MAKALGVQISASTPPLQAAGSSAGRNDAALLDQVERQDICDICQMAGKVYSTSKECQILKCPMCGLIWTNPLLDHMVTYDFKGVYESNEKDQKERFRAQIRTYLAKAGITDARGLRILEIGSGLGFFLDVCEEFGILVEGCDIADDSILRANRNRERVRKGTLDESYAGRGFDAIFAFNLIEHLPHPKRFLDDARKALKPGGMLVLETPIQESLFHRVARAGGVMTRGKLDFYGMRPSGHIYKFSKKTFRLLARSGDWKIVHRENVPSPWGEIWGNSSIIHFDQKLLYRSALPVVYGIANATGQGNRLYVMLQRA